MGHVIYSSLMVRVKELEGVEGVVVVVDQDQ